MGKKRVVSLVAIACIVGLCAIVWLILTRNDNEDTPRKEPIITYSTESPSESKAEAKSYRWGGASDEPKRLVIKKINVDTYIQQAGVDQDNKVAVPNNTHLVGWYVDSATPGSKGLSIISGHVGGPTLPAVFERLGELTTGDNFSVELGNGTIEQYTVIDKKELKESESASELFSQNPKVTSQLNLITCGGEFNLQTQQYNDRVIVSAQKIE